MTSFAHSIIAAVAVEKDHPLESFSCILFAYSLNRVQPDDSNGTD